MKKDISIIINASDSSQNIEKILWAYSSQTYMNFDVFIIGLKEYEQELVNELRDQFFFDIFFLSSNNKWKIPKDSNADYYLFISGKILPNSNFVEQHVKHRVESLFLFGCNHDFPVLEESKVTRELIYNENIFSLSKKYFKKDDVDLSTTLFSLWKEDVEKLEEKMFFNKKINEFNKELNVNLIESKRLSPALKGVLLV